MRTVAQHDVEQQDTAVAGRPPPAPACASRGPKSIIGWGRPSVYSSSPRSSITVSGRGRPQPIVHSGRSGTLDAHRPEHCRGDHHRLDAEGAAAEQPAQPRRCPSRRLLRRAPTSGHVGHRQHAELGQHVGRHRGEVGLARPERRDQHRGRQLRRVWSRTASATAGAGRLAEHHDQLGRPGRRRAASRAAWVDSATDRARRGPVRRRRGSARCRRRPARAGSSPAARRCRTRRRCRPARAAPRWRSRVRRRR